MVSKDKTVKLGLLSNHCVACKGAAHIIQTLWRSGIDDHGRLGADFDSKAMGFEAGISYIRLRRHFFQRVVSAEIGFKICGYELQITPPRP